MVYISFMKTQYKYIITILITIGITAFIMWWFFLRTKEVEKVIETKIIYIEKNGKEIVDTPLVSSRMNHKYIYIDFKLNTPYYGLIHTESKLLREYYQYKHNVNLGIGYFIKSQLIYAELGYSYKNYSIGVMVGYSGIIKQVDYGFKGGYGFRF